MYVSTTYEGGTSCNIEISLKNTIAIFLTCGALMPASRSLMFQLSIPNDQLWVEHQTELHPDIFYF